MRDDLTEQLIDLEHARCAAISTGDIAALEELNSDDLSYTHTGGMTEDREAFLASIARSPRRITRGDDISVRFYGEVAVMTGMLHATFPAPEGAAAPVEMDTHALQVWVKQDQGWKQAAFAASAQLPDSLRG